MKRISKLLLLPAIALTSLTSMAQLVNVDIYSGFSDAGGGAPFSGLVGSFGANGIQFATETGYNWHPFGLGSFGAVMTGCIDVGSFSGSSAFTFSLNSDDGSQLFIDNILIVDNGGAHSPTVATGTANLTGGIHEVRVDFFEDFGGESGVDLALPSSAQYVPCPTASVPDAGATAGLFAISSLLLMGLRRRLG